MFPDIPNLISWAAMYIKVIALLNIAFGSVAALCIGIWYCWPLLRWIGLGLAVRDAIKERLSSSKTDD